MLGLLLACGTDDGSQPGGSDAGPSDMTNSAQDVCSQTAPCDLPVGTSQNEFVFPEGDVDSFSFMAAEGDILDILVQNQVPRSVVSLRATLFGPDGSAVAAGQNGLPPSQPQRFSIQYSTRETGVYRLDVFDVGNDDEDDRNPFTVTVNILPQDDPFEPNDAPEEASPLTLPTVVTGGRIASDGDEDWYSFNIADGGVLRIIPSGAGTEATIRFAWALFRADDPDMPLAFSIEGSNGSWPEERRAVGLDGGTYLLQVRRASGDTSNPAAVYTLDLSVESDPDQNEQNPNESLSTATPIALGASVTGFIASNSDLDFYQFDVTGASSGNPKVIAVTLERTGNPDLTILPQFRIGRAINLGAPDEEFDDLVPCEGDNDPCLSLRRFNDGTLTEARCHDTESCRTAHPITQDGTYYVLVQDFQDDAFDLDTSYRLTVEELPVQAADPDEDFSFGRDNARVVPLETSTTAATLIFQQVTGFISYVGDEDWYRFDVPTDGFEGNPNQNGDWELSFEFFVDGPSEIEYSVLIDRPRGGDGNLPTTVQSGGMSCPIDDVPPSVQRPDPFECDESANQHAIDVGALAEPDPECDVVFREDAGDGQYFMRVRDAGFIAGDDYDLRESARYRFRIRFVGTCRGAPGPCADNPFNADRCPRP